MSATATLFGWRTVEQAATPGPWSTVKYRSHHSDEPEKIRRDAAFITASRTVVPALLGAVEAVLALHTPMEMLHTPSGRVVTVCLACPTATGERVYPCPTVRAIETHVGGAS